MEILQARAPEAAEALSREVVAFVQRLRTEDLFKKPGVAETIDWAKCLLALDVLELSPEVIADTLGAILKYQDDIRKLQGSEAKRCSTRRARGWNRPDASSGRKYPGGVGVSAPTLTMPEAAPLDLPDNPAADAQHHPFRPRAAQGRAAGGAGARGGRDPRGRGGGLHLARRFLPYPARLLHRAARAPGGLCPDLPPLLARPALHGAHDGDDAARHPRRAGRARREAAEKRAAEALLDGASARRPRQRATTADEETEIEVDASLTMSARGTAQDARFRTDEHRRDAQAKRMLARLALPVKPSPRAGQASHLGRGSTPADTCAPPCAGAARCGASTTPNRARAGPTWWCCATSPAR